MDKELKELLQECDTLKAHLSELRPLPAEAMQKIEEAFALEYTYESNRIEGNTLTLQETELVVNEGVTIAGKSMREHLEAINHAEAIDYIKDFAKSSIEISERTVKEIPRPRIARHKQGECRAVQKCPRHDFRQHTYSATAVFAGQTDGGLYHKTAGNGNRKGTSHYHSCLPARRTGAHSSVHRRQRPHFPPADEPVFAPQRLHDC